MEIKKSHLDITVHKQSPNSSIASGCQSGEAESSHLDAVVHEQCSWNVLIFGLLARGVPFGGALLGLCRLVLRPLRLVTLVPLMCLPTTQYEWFSSCRGNIIHYSPLYQVEISEVYQGCLRRQCHILVSCPATSAFQLPPQTSCTGTLGYIPSSEVL